MSGFSVFFNEFKSENLYTTGLTEAKVPDGLGSAESIPIMYRYELEGKDPVPARLIVVCPSFTTRRGIQPFRMGTKVDDTKLSIPVVFNPDDESHTMFLGSFGNKYEYTEDDNGVFHRAHEDFTPPSGVLGSVYGWCVEQYASYLSKKRGKDKPSLNDERKAVEAIKHDSFFFTPKPKEGDTKYSKDPKPMKYFKLMVYKKDTPEENITPFYNIKRERIPYKTLCDRSFEFTPILSFRRIFIGKTIAVTMEITSAVVTKELDSGFGMSKSTTRLIDDILKRDPTKILEAFNVMSSQGEDRQSSHNVSGCKVDDDDDDRRPVLPEEDDEENLVRPTSRK